MRDNVHLGAHLFDTIPDHDTRNTAAGLLTGYSSFVKNGVGSFLPGNRP